MSIFFLTDLSGTLFLREKTLEPMDGFYMELQAATRPRPFGRKPLTSRHAAQPKTMTSPKPKTRENQGHERQARLSQNASKRMEHQFQPPAPGTQERACSNGKNGRQRDHSH
jgi:hypothetical protein